MFDKLIYKLRHPKYCKNCGGKLVIDEKFDYSDQTGEPIARHVGIRCEFWHVCFKKHGYLYKWREAVEHRVHADAGDSVASSDISNASSETTSQAETKPAQRG